MKKNLQPKVIVKRESQIHSYEDLFQLWKDIPVIQKISDPSIAKTSRHPIQKFILKILREGIIDKNGKKRNFLIANEILECVNHELDGIDKSIKISMLYYHLDKLQESNLVDYVYYVEGRHKRKYFGRTAKFYLFSSETKDEKIMEKYFAPISKLIIHYNPDTDIEKYEKIVEKIKIDQSEFSKGLIDWMKSNHELLYDLDIDPLDLFESMFTMLFGQSSIKKLISELIPHMKFLS